MTKNNKPKFRAVTLSVTEDLHAAFMQACAEDAVSASLVVRQAMRDYLARRNATLNAGGALITTDR